MQIRKVISYMYKVNNLILWPRRDTVRVFWARSHVVYDCAKAINIIAPLWPLDGLRL